LEAFDRCERLYGASLTKQDVPSPTQGDLAVVIVRASDLEKAQQRQEWKTVEVNVVGKTPIPVSIAKREGK